MKKLSVISILCGVGLFMFGLFSWQPAITGLRGATYDTWAKLSIAIGAVLAVAGSFLYRHKSS
jgi:Na+/H+ antiporter NhaA